MDAKPEQVLLESLERGLVTLTLNRPERRNALNPELGLRLVEAATRAATDPEVRAVLLKGAGGTFCVGGDVKAMVAGAGRDETPDRRFELLRHRVEVSRLLHDMRKPTLAMISGSAAGAGLSLALACDLRIAGKSAKLTTAFAKVGLSGDYGGTYFLTRLVGSAKARELYLTSPILMADEALALGLVTRVVPDAELEAAARELAVSLAQGPSVALGYIKQNINAAELNRPGQSQCRRLSALNPFLHPHLDRGRPGVADVLDIIDLVARAQFLEIAGQHTVAGEIQEPALLGQQEAEILLGIELRDLPQKLVLGVVLGLAGAALALVLQLDQLILGDPERFVDGVVKIGCLKFALQMIGLMGHHEVLAARDSHLNAHHRRDRAAAGLGALIDPDAAASEPIVDLLQLLDPVADLLLRPGGACHVVEGDLDGALHGRALCCCEHLSRTYGRPSRFAPGRLSVHASPPPRHPDLERPDAPRDGKSQDREHDDASHQLIGLHQISGLEHEGADAGFRTDHLGGDHEEERDRSGDAEPGDDVGKRARQDHLAHDAEKRQFEALRHADEVSRDLIDAAVDGDHGGEEHAERDGGDLRGLADAEPEDEQRQERDLRDREQRGHD